MNDDRFIKDCAYIINAASENVSTDIDVILRYFDFSWDSLTESCRIRRFMVRYDTGSNRGRFCV